jgi:hypothetical protein
LSVEEASQTAWGKRSAGSTNQQPNLTWPYFTMVYYWIYFNPLQKDE